MFVITKIHKAVIFTKVMQYYHEFWDHNSNGNNQKLIIQKILEKKEGTLLFKSCQSALQEEKNIIYQEKI